MTLSSVCLGPAYHSLTGKWWHGHGTPAEDGLAAWRGSREE